MAVPLLVNFDRYTELTLGLDSVSAGGNPIPNGVGLVTGWLSNALWEICADVVSTSWTACASSPTTFWTSCYSNPSTTWSDC